MTTHWIDPAFEVAFSQLFDLAVQFGYTGGPPGEPITYQDCKEKRRITRVTQQGVELFTKVWRPQTRHQWITEFVAGELVYVGRMESRLWNKKKKSLRKDVKDPLFFRQLLRDRPYWKNASAENAEAWFYGYRKHLDPNRPTSLQASSQQRTKENSIFPTPPGTPWEEVTIDFIEENKVKVEAGSKVNEYFYDKIGFGKKRDGKPTRLWGVFRNLAMLNGCASADDLTREEIKRKNVSKYISDLRTKLFELTGIRGDPFFDVAKISNYQAKFHLQATFCESLRKHTSDQSYAEHFDEEISHPKFKAKGKLKPTSDQQFRHSR